jgi:hypothetical protein
MDTRLGTAIALAIASLALPAAAAGAPVSDAFRKPLEDGCQRNVPGLLTYSSPEWVWVNSDRVKGADNVRHLTGGVRDPHTAGEDLPENHLSYDFDFNVAPDPSYRGLAGGSPSANGGKGSGNWDRTVPEEYGQLHIEWESGVVPTYAWPDEGDRVDAWGQWIWDCGHWGEGFDFSAPGANDPTAPLTHNGDYLTPGETESELIGTPEAKKIRGEQTELHPLQALVVHRARSYGAAARERQTDAFISTRGTGAHAEERCAHDLRPPAGQPVRGPDFTACVHDTSKEYQSLSGRTFAFVVPAPPRPSRSARLRYREVRRVAEHHAHTQITPKSDGLHVRVSFDRVARGTLEELGRSWFVGWEGDDSAGPARVRFTLRSIRVNRSLDPNPDRPQQSGVPPGEYNLYVDVNGLWRFVGGRGIGTALGGSPPQWVPGLGATQDGQTFGQIDRRLDLFVPSGKPLRVFVDARECDLPHMDPCAVTAELSDGNDAPGDHQDEFESAADAVGTHVLKPQGDAYEMTYSIARTPGRAPCVDVRAPASRFARRDAAFASRSGVRLRGRASDRGCGGLAAVELAVARHLGHRRCRYMRPSGGLRRAGPCGRPDWIPAAGLERWKLRIRHDLQRGTYTAHVRAVDGTRNVELFTRRARGPQRNFLKFRVR